MRYKGLSLKVYVLERLFSRVVTESYCLYRICLCLCHKNICIQLCIRIYTCMASTESR